MRERRQRVGHRHVRERRAVHRPRKVHQTAPHSADASHDIVKQHTLPVQPSSVSLHPKQDVFVAGCVTDEWVRIYDYNTADELQLHKGHHGPVHCVSYSPDGEVSASGSEDGTVRLWQTSPGKKYGLWA